MSLKLPRNWDFSTFKETSRIGRSRSVVPGESGPGGSGGSGGTGVWSGVWSGGSPGSLRSMERPLKAGWLRKQQRSLVKNWQHRYFVLRGSTLTYHKDDKESTVQGVIQLRFSKVNKLPPNADDAKYLFEIIPRAKGDRERCSHVFMASSQSDLDEWVRTLRRVIGAPSSGVFGKSLADTVASEQRFGPRSVPILVQKCVEFIKEFGLSEEGIFRLPGQDNAVRQFRDAFDAGERPSFPSDTDVHTVASLLKLYLRELPQPVVPWTQYQDFLDCTSVLDSPGQTGWDKLETQIALLPRVNYDLLSYTCRFLFEVQLHSKVNKMNVENLATVMGINLLKPQIEDPITVMKATPQIQKLMTVMIRQHEALFPPSGDELPSPPPNKSDGQKNAPRNFVGWESTELCDTSLSESPEEEDQDQDSPGPLRPDAALDPASLQFEESPDDGPRKRTRTLPSFSCPPAGTAAKAEALSRWSRIQESVEDKSATFSEDIFKILDLKSCGSFFGTSGLSGREEEVKSRRSSDRNEAKEDAKAKEQKTLVQSLALQKSVDKPSVDKPSVDKPSVDKPSVDKPSVDKPSVDKPSVDKPSVDKPSVDKPRATNENKCGAQRDGPQLLDSLQTENKELKATVAELRSELEAERHRVAALEICLKNAERNRDEAQRRNQELQKDIQKFLSIKPPP